MIAKALGQIALAYAAEVLCHVVDPGWKACRAQKRQENELSITVYIHADFTHLQKDIMDINCALTMLQARLEALDSVRLTSAL